MSQIDLGYCFKLEIVDSRSTRGDLFGEASFLSSRTILDAGAHYQNRFEHWNDV
jgi:hypothetical protein